MSAHDPSLQDHAPGSAEELLAQFYSEWDGDDPVAIDELCDEHRELAEELTQLHLDCQQIEPLLGQLVDWGFERGFELGEELGHGSFGQVYRAKDRLLEHEVALKIVNERALFSVAARERFLHEARTLASLNHPNVVRIYYVDQHEGRWCLSMELIDGMTLHQLVERSGPLSAVEAVRIGIDLAHALAAIHSRGVVHMDVKPANVMREKGGRIVLLDFGFARSLDARHDADDAIGGTPLFMSPEQIHCEPALGPESDVYSLGVLLFWLLSKAYPHEAPTVEELRLALRRDEPRRLADTGADVPGELAAIVERATARDQAKRYASAGELEHALREFLTSFSGLAPQPGEIRLAGRRFSRRGLWIAGAATVALALGAWGLFSGPRSLDVEYVLYAMRGVDGRQLVPLRDDDPVAVGERLCLTLRTNQPAHVYIFNADEAGNFFGMFPLDGSVTNPLLPGQLHDLPGSGADWLVSEAGGGSEYVYVMASTAPIPEVQQLHAECAKAGEVGLGADRTAAIVETIPRGIGKVHRREVDGDAVKRVRALFDGLAAQRSPDARVFRLRLAHP